MRIQTSLVALLAFVCLGQTTAAQQSLNASLFERYLVLLREQVGIPGLSGAIVQGGRVIWSAGLGQANLESSLPARADTPYPVLGLTQAISSTLLLQQCVDYGHLEIDDSVRRWVPDYASQTLTIAELLSHTSGGQYQLEPSRFAIVAEVIRQCANARFPSLLAERLEQLGMVDSVPGADATSTANQALFSSSQLEKYARALPRLAAPYRVDDRGRATPSGFNSSGLNPASGLISSALDLAYFDIGVRNGFLLSPETLRLAWTPTAGQAGLGWFVQRVGSDTVVWQYGLEPGAYSSLIIKVPGRDVTLVLLANSDAVSAAYAAGAPDVNASLFARLFFRIFLV